MNARNPRTFAIENDLIRFSLSPVSHFWQLQDKRAGVTWGSPRGSGPWLSLISGEKRVPLSVSRVEVRDDALHCRFVSPRGRDSGGSIVFRLVDEALQMYLVPEGPLWPVIEVFGTGLEAGADEDGLALLPVRMGLLIPAQGARPFETRLATYESEGLAMAMVGLIKSGAALMADWQDPYIRVCLARRFEEDAPRLRVSFELTKTARSLELRCLGRGDMHTIAQAYRQRAEDLGYRQPWSQKLPARPQATRLFGACNFKLWHALARRVDKDMQEQAVEVHWTFDEAAQIAEHLKQDLQLDDVLFHLGGWTRYGYDCRHPDIMPANPECGGNEGLADLADRVRRLGYLFCLHDNYQDMYRDAPSWDEYWLQKRPDGSPYMGGVLAGWAGLLHLCPRSRASGSAPRKSARRTGRLPPRFVLYRHDLLSGAAGVLRPAPSADAPGRHPLEAGVSRLRA